MMARISDRVLRLEAAQGGYDDEQKAASMKWLADLCATFPESTPEEQAEGERAAAALVAYLEGAGHGAKA